MLTLGNEDDSVRGGPVRHQAYVLEGWWEHDIAFLPGFDWPQFDQLVCDVEAAAVEVLRGAREVVAFDKRVGRLVPNRPFSEDGFLRGSFWVVDAPHERVSNLARLLPHRTVCPLSDVGNDRAVGSAEATALLEFVSMSPSFPTLVTCRAEGQVYLIVGSYRTVDPLQQCGASPS